MKHPGPILDKPASRPTVPEVSPLIIAYYEHEPVGGNLHIVLDDGNIADSYIQWCLDRMPPDDSEGERIGRMLLQMTKTQRRKAIGGLR